MNYPDVARTLTIARVRRGLSQSDVARLMETSQSHVSDLENLRRPRPSLDVVDRWAQSLGYQLRLERRPAGKRHAPGDDDR